LFFLISIARNVLNTDIWRIGDDNIKANELTFIIQSVRKLEAPFKCVTKNAISCEELKLRFFLCYGAFDLFFVVIAFIKFEEA
jgi:hypothetical protein